MSFSILYEISSTFSIIGMFLTCLLNPLLIYITLFKIQKILGMYRNLVVIAAVLGILFSIEDILVHPFFHSMNSSFFFFTFQDYGDSLMTFCLLVYAFLHSSLISFISVQFIYRYWVITNNSKVRHFKSWKLILWLTYAFLFGLIYSSSILLLCPTSLQAKEHLRATFLNSYNVPMENTHGFVFTGNNGIAGAGCLLGIVIIQFSVMIFCGVRMHRELEKNQDNVFVSSSFKTLQRQFLKVLIFQISGPSILFYLPLVPIFMAPLFNLEFAFQSGVLISTFSLFPSIDSIILMTVVTEYRKTLKSLCKSREVRAHSNRVSSGLKFVVVT